jgi:hypothetical protein
VTASWGETGVVPVATEAVLDVGGVAAEDSESWAQVGGQCAHPQVGADAALVGQGEEDVVVGSCAQADGGDLRVYGEGAAEEGYRVRGLELKTAQFRHRYVVSVHRLDGRSPQSTCSMGAQVVRQ